MTEFSDDWRGIYKFWFPPRLADADHATLARMIPWWMAGGATAELPRFRSVLDAAIAGQLHSWCTEPVSRLSLILVLDQFTRGLFAGTAAAYASDPATLRICEEGLKNGHYDALTSPWEQSFFALPLGHAEGPDHSKRLERVVSLSEARLAAAPEGLKRILAFEVSQAKGHLDVIQRFGRFPHRNSILGRTSTAAELAYLEKGEFVHNRRPPP